MGNNPGENIIAQNKIRSQLADNKKGTGYFFNIKKACLKKVACPLFPM